jgi:hypothetical protein
MSKSKRNSNEETHLEKSQNYLSTATLKQGMQFRNYQKKISNLVKSNINEGFSTQQNSYSEKSFNTLVNNSLTDTDVSNIHSANQQYRSLLQKNPIQPDASQDKNIDQTSQELNSFATNIISSTKDILNKTSNVNSQINSNDKVFSSSLQNLNNINSVGGQESYLDNIQGILRDSDILVLQENYRYLMWSILAICVVSISLSFLQNRTSNNTQ